MSKRNVKQKGFSLIELMVSLVIGLIVVAAITQVFVGSKVTYSMQSGLSKIQENGRFAMAFLTRDLRQAGYTGCTSNTTFANTVRDSSGAVPSFLDITNLVSGQDNMNGTDAFNRTPLAGTDVVEVRFVDPSGACDIDKHVETSANLHCTADHDFERGEILVVTDCTHTAVFQFAKAGTTNKIVVHGAGASVDPGNCTKGLGAPVDCSSPNGTGYQYNNGSVLRMSAYRYYVANNTLGEPALYRESISTTTGTSGIAHSELVEGIENMQVLYGEDTSGNGTADYYVPFDEVSDAEDIISIRVSLLVTSIEDNLVQGTQTLLYNGGTVNFNDGHLRKVFTSTIALRNRL
ncbi:MAG: PilW family protein [Neptuniibacter sp.]